MLQAALIILFVIVALCLVIAVAMSLLCGEVRTLKDEADEKDAKLTREIDWWRSGR
jgi:hypothetical protein